jgi:hypothetical protein
MQIVNYHNTAWGSVGMQWMMFQVLAGGLVHSSHRVKYWQAGGMSEQLTPRLRHA